MRLLDSIISWFREWQKKRQHDKKMQEVYDRLDNNAAGKFSKTQYIKDIKKVSKLKKDRK